MRMMRVLKAIRRVIQTQRTMHFQSLRTKCHDISVIQTQLLSVGIARSLVTSLVNVQMNAQDLTASYVVKIPTIHSNATRNFVLNVTR